VAANANVTFMNTHGNYPYSNTAFGFGIAPGLDVVLGHNFIFNLGLSGGINFPKSSPQFVVGSVAGLGYNF
ncbi:MAG: hypothetical protein V4591_09770, partial [Bdellovibrionota bacterium]